jgi:hypothetical protein
VAEISKERASYEIDLLHVDFRKFLSISQILDSPYYVFVAFCIVVIVVSLIFKMAYFLSSPVQELLKKLGSGAR